MAESSRANISTSIKESKQSFVKKAQELFSICDKDEKGFITKRDMWKLHRELPLTPEQLENVFDSLDKNNIDYLTEEEFIEGFASYLGVDIKSLEEQEELIKKKQEKEREEEEVEEELEEFLNQMIDHGNEESDIALNLNQAQSRTPKVTTTDLKRVMEDLGKRLRGQQIKYQPVHKEFHYLHRCYSWQIYTVMKKWETIRQTEYERKSPDLAEENHSYSSSTMKNQQNLISEDQTEENKRKFYLEIPKTDQRLSSSCSNIYFKASSCHYNSASSIWEEQCIKSYNYKERSTSLLNLVNISTQNEKITDSTESRKISSDCDIPSIVDPDRLYKIIFIGDSGVGKSSFINRFCCEVFRPTFQSTLGIDYRVKTINANGHLVTLQLWDTAGQERYWSLTKQYFRKIDGIIFMYDVTSAESFHNIRNWISNTKNSHDHQNVVYVVMGNKLDLCEKLKRKEIATSRGKELAKKCNALFYEISCKTGNNILNIMREIAGALQTEEDEAIKEFHQLKPHKELRKCC